MQSIPCNLDALSADDLAAFITDAPRLAIPAEVPEELHVMFRIDLCNYALTMQQARACRLAGNITQAQRFEGCMERAYNRLPSALRW